MATILNRAIKPQGSDRYPSASKVLEELKSICLTPNRATYGLGASISARNAVSQKTQLLPCSSNTPVTIIYSLTRNWRQPAWVFGCLLVVGLIAALATFQTRKEPKPASSSPTLDTPTSVTPTANPTPSLQSPVSTANKADTPVTPAEPEDIGKSPATLPALNRGSFCPISRLATDARYFGGNVRSSVPPDIKQGLLQVLQPRLDNFRFSVGSLRVKLYVKSALLFTLASWMQIPMILSILPMLENVKKRSTQGSLLIHIQKRR